MAETVAVMYMGRIVEYAEVENSSATPAPLHGGLMNSIRRGGGDCLGGPDANRRSRVVPSLLSLPDGLHLPGTVCSRAKKECGERPLPDLSRTSSQWHAGFWITGPLLEVQRGPKVLSSEEGDLRKQVRVSQGGRSAWILPFEKGDPWARGESGCEDGHWADAF